MSEVLYQGNVGEELSALRLAVQAVAVNLEKGSVMRVFKGPNGAVCYLRPRDITIIGDVREVEFAAPDASPFTAKVKCLVRQVGLSNGDKILLLDTPDLFDAVA